MLLSIFEVGNPNIIYLSNPSLITTAFGSSLLLKWRLINLISLNFLGLVCFAGSALTLTKSLKENELIKAPIIRPWAFAPSCGTRAVSWFLILYFYPWSLNLDLLSLNLDFLSLILEHLYELHVVPGRQLLMVSGGVLIFILDPWYFVLDPWTFVSLPPVVPGRQLLMVSAWPANVLVLDPIFFPWSFNLDFLSLTLEPWFVILEPWFLSLILEHLYQLHLVAGRQLLMVSGWCPDWRHSHQFTSIHAKTDHPSPKCHSLAGNMVPLWISPMLPFVLKSLPIQIKPSHLQIRIRYIKLIKQWQHGPLVNISHALVDFSKVFTYKSNSVNCNLGRSPKMTKDLKFPCTKSSFILHIGWNTKKVQFSHFQREKFSLTSSLSEEARWSPDFSP